MRRKMRRFTNDSVSLVPKSCRYRFAGPGVVDSPHVRTDSGELWIQTLGRIGSSDGQFNRQHQLVTILAYIGLEGPVDRTTLATLFWPTSPNPLNSLSSALTRIRRLAPDAVTIEDALIRTSIAIDAAVLRSALGHGTDDLTAHQQHVGPFLKGVRIRNVGVELEEWIFDTRDRLSDAAARNAIEACRVAQASGRTAEATQLAERAVQLASSKQAIADHADELFTPLSSIDPVGARELMTIASAPEAAPVAPPSSLIVDVRDPSTQQFLGRGRELGQLQRLRETTRVVNVFGLSGAGKTSVVERSLDGAAHPVHWVDGKHAPDFDPLDTLASLVGGTDSPNGSDPAVSSIDRIAEHLTPETVIVLDHLDHLDSATSTQAAADLAGLSTGHVIIITRVRIGSGAGAARGPVTTGDESAELAETLCSSVSGLPAALQLVGAWLRVLPSDQVLAAFDDGSLMSERPPGDDRALVEIATASWDALDADQQDVLLALCVIPASFDSDTATALAGIGLTELGELLDHGFLERVGDRFACSRLTRFVALDQLAHQPAQYNTAVTALATHMADRVIAIAPALTAPEAGDALARLAGDQPSIMVAFLATLGLDDDELARRFLAALDTYLLRSGQTEVAHEIYSAAFEQLPAIAESAPELCAEVAANLAWVEMLLGQPDAAERHIAWALDVVPADAVEIHVALLRTRCALHGNVGDAERALEGYLEAREIAAAVDRPELTALLDEDIGRMYLMLDQIPEATDAFRRTLDGARLVGDPHIEARSQLLLGVALSSTDPARAQVLFDEGEELANAHGLRHLAAFFPADRGYALLIAAEYQAARGEFSRGIALADEAGDRPLWASCHIGLGRAELRAAIGSVRSTRSRSACAPRSRSRSGPTCWAPHSTSPTSLSPTIRTTRAHANSPASPWRTPRPLRSTGVSSGTSTRPRRLKPLRTTMTRFASTNSAS